MADYFMSPSGPDFEIFRQGPAEKHFVSRTNSVVQKMVTKMLQEEILVEL